MKNQKKLNIVFIGLSITSSWGNGHATTYRSLISALASLGHKITFFEYDVPWYSSNRDMPQPPFCQTILYKDYNHLKSNFSDEMEKADFLILGSYVRQGVETANWLLKISNCPVAFYDIDTPITLAKLAKRDYEYIEDSLIPRFSVYLSFTGGKTLDILHDKFHSPLAKPLFCCVDTQKYFPKECSIDYDLGYLGTYSSDRQPALKKLMLDAAANWSDGKFIVAGPQYPSDIAWPKNTIKLEHIEPNYHSKFYNSQRYTMNITRSDMKKAGFSPSVRLFEAAACGTPIISDYWQGIETFFVPKEEILISDSPETTLKYIKDTSEERRKEIGVAARKRVLEEHSSIKRAKELLKILNGLS